MTFSLFAGLVLPFALQAAATPPTKPDTFADLPIEEATAPRCGMAFAIVQGWQEGGDERGGQWPSMAQANAREFFLQAMVRLIDQYTLERADVMRLVEAEQERHRADEFASVDAMMPACLALLEAKSLQNAIGAQSR